MSALATYEYAVAQIRAHGPMTALKVAQRLGWPEWRAQAAIKRARRLALLTKVGKQADKRFVFAAVQVPGWPLPAPDCEARP